MVATSAAYKWEVNAVHRIVVYKEGKEVEWCKFICMSMFLFFSQVIYYYYFHCVFLILLLFLLSMFLAYVYTLYCYICTCITLWLFVRTCVIVLVLYWLPHFGNVLISDYFKFQTADISFQYRLLQIYNKLYKIVRFCQK